MNFRYILAFIGTVIIGIAGRSAPLGPEESLSRALRDGPAKISGHNSRYRLAKSEKAGELTTLYLFEKENGAGFLLTPADDEVAPVIGYGDTKIFDENGEFAPGFAYWMGEMSRQIEYAETSGRSSGSVRYMRPERAAIEPLCTTKWYQDYPYNKLCPEIDGKLTYTGCVATAMAQVMKYHNWPDRGEGTAQYDWEQQTLTMDFSNTEFNWSSMLDSYAGSYTATEANAVAVLMKAAGYGVTMKYGTNGSGASSYAIAPALGSYFRYDKSLRFLQRNYYGLIDWENILYESLKTYGPVVYNGMSSSGGHSFVCDGYQGDGYFHINWGWGGMSDGYFLLDILDPEHQGIGGADGGFDYMQDMIVDIRPDRSGNSEWSFQLCSDDACNVALREQDGEPVLWLFSQAVNYGPGPIIDMNIGLRFKDISESSSAPKDFLDPIEDDLPIFWGFEKIGFGIPEMPDGTYEVTFIYSSGRGEVYPVMFPIYGTSQVLLTYKDGIPSLEVKNVQLPLLRSPSFPYMVNKLGTVTVKGRLENPNDSQYGCPIAIVFLNESMSGIVAYGPSRMVDMDAKETVDFSITSNIKYLDGLPNGYYYIALALFESPLAGNFPLIGRPQPVYVSYTNDIPDILGSDQEGVREFYTLDGAKAAVWEEGAPRPALAPGLYIVRSAKGTYKILLRE